MIGQPFALSVHELTFAEWDACLAPGGCGGHEPDDQRLGPRVAPGVQRVVGRRAGVRDVAVGADGRGVPACRVRPSGSTRHVRARLTKYQLGERNRGEPGTNCLGLPEVFGTIGQTAPGGLVCVRTRFGLHDMHGNVFGVDAGLLERKLSGVRHLTAARGFGGDCAVRVYARRPLGQHTGGTSASRTAAGTSPTSARATSVSALPGRSLHESLLPYVVGGSKWAEPPGWVRLVRSGNALPALPAARSVTKSSHRLGDDKGLDG